VYAPEYESGLRFNDPMLNIDWPIDPAVISEKDRSWGLLDGRIQEINSSFLSGHKEN